MTQRGPNRPRKAPPGLDLGVEDRETLLSTIKLLLSLVDLAREGTTPGRGNKAPILLQRRDVRLETSDQLLQLPLGVLVLLALYIGSVCANMTHNGPTYLLAGSTGLVLVNLLKLEDGLGEDVLTSLALGGDSLGGAITANRDTGGVGAVVRVYGAVVARQVLRMRRVRGPRTQLAPK